MTKDELNMELTHYGNMRGCRAKSQTAAAYRGYSRRAGESFDRITTAFDALTERNAELETVLSELIEGYQQLVSWAIAPSELRGGPPIAGKTLEAAIRALPQEASDAHQQ